LVVIFTRRERGVNMEHIIAYIYQKNSNKIDHTFLSQRKNLYDRNVVDQHQLNVEIIKLHISKTFAVRKFLGISSIINSQLSILIV